MSYCAPQAPNHGFLDHGCAVYGGLLVNQKHLFKNTKAENKHFFIPQFNLLNHWERHYLEPHSLGFPRFLARFFDSNKRMILAPGHWPYDTHDLQTRNRNLLTGFAKDETTVKLWTVSQHTDRRRLLEFLVRLKDDPDSLNEKWEIVNNEFEDASGSRVINIPSSALELRYGSAALDEFYLFARCENGLYMIKSASEDVTPVVRTPVKAFSLLPYMDNEMIVLDGGYFLWHGDLETGCQFSRVKTPNQISLIAPSDHPRLIYAANEESVFIVDLRENSATGKSLYFVPDYDNVDAAGPKNRYKGCFKKPVIKHLKSMNEIPRVFLVATTKKFVLFDERMPCSPYLETAHSVVDGGDYLCSAPPFVDPENSPARVFSFYILKHTASPDVQHFSLYDSGGGLQWSMLSPIKRLLEPVAAADFFREQPKYGVRISRWEQNFLFGFGPTRSIHIQDGLANDRFGNVRHLMFRTTDDGSLWLEALRVVDDKALEDSAVREVAIEIQRRLKEPLGFGWQTGDQRRTNESGNVYRNVIGPYALASMDEELRFDNLCSPLELCFEDTYPEPPVIEVIDDPEKLISQLVLNCFNKS